MRTLILNSSNIVENTDNSQLQYNFPAGSIVLNPGDKVALASLQMYYSTFNLTSANNNNTFSYTWIDGTVNSVVFPDGFYDADGINDYLHFVMINNKHYLTNNTTGEYVYFINITTNANRYAIQVDCYPIGQDLYATPTDYTIPSGATWSNPAAGANELTPTLTVPSTNFRYVIGFAAGTYGTQATGTTTTSSTISSFTPQITPLSSYILTCDLVNNNFAVPNSLIYSFSPQGTFGEQFTIAPNQYVFIDAQPGNYSFFRMRFLDQDLKPVAIQDEQMVIMIIISSKGDNLGL
jgi:hypothetical protein